MSRIECIATFIRQFDATSEYASTPVSRPRRASRYDANDATFVPIIWWHVGSSFGLATVFEYAIHGCRNEPHFTHD
jgi:hypothetical protein